MSNIQTVLTLLGLLVVLVYAVYILAKCERDPVALLKRVISNLLKDKQKLLDLVDLIERFDTLQLSDEEKHSGVVNNLGLKYNQTDQSDQLLKICVELGVLSLRLKSHLKELEGLEQSKHEY